MVPQEASSLPLRLILIFGCLVAGVGIFWVLDLDLQNSSTMDEESLRITHLSDQAADTSAENADRLAEGDPLLAGEGNTGLFMNHERQMEAIPASILISSIQGKVVNKDAKPVEQAKILLESALPEMVQDVIPMGDYFTTGQTNKQGIFSLPVPDDGVFTLQIIKEGFAPKVITLALPGDDLVIELATGIQMSGLVLEEETKTPLENAWIRARHDGLSILSETDKKGAFSLMDLPVGLIDLELFHPGHDVEKLKSIFIQEERENYLEIFLKEGSSLEGLILDRATESPIPKAEIEYIIGFKDQEEVRELFRETAVADAQGAFLFEKVSRRGYRLLIRAEGYSPVIREPLRNMGKSGGARKIFLTKEGALSGRVYDPSANPLSQARVKVIQNGLWEKQEKIVYSDESGRFLLSPLDAGTLTVYASHPDHGPVITEGIELPPDGAVENLDLYLAQNSIISGYAYKQDGTPASRARILLDGLRPSFAKIFHMVPVTLADSTGFFRFERFPEGDYRVSATLDQTRSPPEEVALLGGQEISLVLSLAKGHSIHGRVEDSGGTPVDDVLITGFAVDPEQDWTNPAFLAKQAQRVKKKQQAWTKRTQKLFFSPWNMISRKLTQYRGSCRTGEDGCFILNGLLEEDLLLLRISKQGYKSQFVTNLSPSHEEVCIELELVFHLQGQVLDGATYEPVPAFAISLKNKAQPPLANPLAALTGTGKQDLFFRSEDGLFTLDHILPGEYTLQINAKGYMTSKLVTLDVSPVFFTPFQIIHLDRSGTLRGQVNSPMKMPIPGVSVYVQPARKEGGSAPGGKTKKSASQKGGKKKAKDNKQTGSTQVRGLMQIRTDKKGRFSFKDLKPNSYEICVGHPSKPVTRIKTIRIAPGQSASTGFTLKNLGSLECKVMKDSGFFVKSRVTLSGGPANLVQRAETGNIGTVGFKNILPGKYQLTVESKGHKTYKKKLTIIKGNNPSMDIYLTQKNK